MAFNPSRREIRELEDFLHKHLDDPPRRAREQQAALRDAERLVRKRLNLPHVSVVDYEIRWCVETRDEQGYGIAGIISAPDGRTWEVRYNPATGERRLKRGR
jgi:hypothetical protein